MAASCLPQLSSYLTLMLKSGKESVLSLWCLNWMHGNVFKLP